MKTPWLFPAGPVLALLAAACGGNVVVDATGGQGGTGGSGGGSSACEADCDAIATAGCPLPEQDQCVSQCLQGLAELGKCAPASIAYIRCHAQLPAAQVCSPGTCEDEQTALYSCAHPPGGCTVTSCTLGSGGTQCPSTCGSNSYETVCTDTPPSYACTCTLNGATVGTCTETDSSLGGCCWGIFAGP
jgi:hypothetical protein